MISDDTIDTTTAKCWCIFSEPEFRSQLKKASSPASKKQMQVNEGIMSTFSGALQSFNGFWQPIMLASSVIAFIGPYLFNAIKKIRYRNDDAIARIEFEADGSDYAACFNIKQMKWILTGSSSVNTSDVVSFFRTKFFDDFVKSCISYIAPIIENEKMILENIDKLDNSNSKKFIQTFFKYKERILTNLIYKKYIT